MYQDRDIKCIAIFQNLIPLELMRGNVMGFKIVNLNEYFSYFRCYVSSIHLCTILRIPNLYSMTIRLKCVNETRVICCAGGETTTKSSMFVHNNI